MAHSEVLHIGKSLTPTRLRCHRYHCHCNVGYHATLTNWVVCPKHRTNMLIIVATTLLPVLIVFCQKREDGWLAGWLPALLSNHAFVSVVIRQFWCWQIFGCHSHVFDNSFTLDSFRATAVRQTDRQKNHHHSCIMLASIRPTCNNDGND